MEPAAQRGYKGRFLFSNSLLRLNGMPQRVLRPVLLGLLLPCIVPSVLAQATLVADLAPGGASSYVSDLTVYGDALYFTAEADGRGLWRYDAQRDTVELVVPLGPDEVGPAHLTALDDRLFFTVDELHDDGVSARIWSFDGRTDMAAPISEVTLPFAQLVVYDGRLFFRSHSDDTGYGLWAYDANAGTTTLAASGSVFESNVGDLTMYDGKLFFRAQSDPFGDDYELWSFEASTGVVAQAADINPSGSSFPNGLTLYGERLFFAARDTGANEELWQYDATTGEATLAADLSQSLTGSLPRDLTHYDGRLFFSVLGDNYNRELWTYDAATAEASFVSEVSPSNSELGGMTVSNGQLFFPGYGGSELWAFDAATGTSSVLVHDVRPRHLTAYDGRVFFSGSDTEHGTELWVYAAPVTTAEEPDAQHAPTVLSPAFPNPTGYTATIALTLSEAQHTRLAVYDALGREVTVLHDGVLSATTHAFRFESAPLQSGVYFIRAAGKTFNTTQRITIAR